MVPKKNEHLKSKERNSKQRRPKEEEYERATITVTHSCVTVQKSQMFKCTQKNPLKLRTAHKVANM